MRTIILIMVCALISGCNLFKKTSKDILVAKSGAEIEMRNVSDLSILDNSRTIDLNTKVKNEFNRSGYQVKADRIKVNPDGSIEAEGEAEVTGFRENKKGVKDSLSRIHQADVDLSLRSDQAQKGKTIDSLKKVEKKSEPSGKGMLIATVCAMIFVFGLLWYFGIKKN